MNCHPLGILKDQGTLFFCCEWSTGILIKQIYTTFIFAYESVCRHDGRANNFCYSHDGRAYYISYSNDGCADYIRFSHDG